MKKNKLICIGSIGKPRGLKGEFFLNSFCNPPKNIISYTKYIKTNNDIDLKIEYIKENNIQTVIFDDELTPTQQLNLEKILKAKIIDKIFLYMQCKTLRIHDTVYLLCR